MITFIWLWNVHTVHRPPRRLSGALHTGPWIWIRCGLGIRSQRPLYPDPSCVLCCAGQCVTPSPAVQCTQSSWRLELTWDHIESGLGIRIQWIRFQCPCGKPQCHWGNKLRAENVKVVSDSFWHLHNWFFFNVCIKLTKISHHYFENVKYIN